MFGGVGALIYIAVEVIPDVGLLRGSFQVFPRRKRIKQLEGLVLDNPSIGNYEELGDLYLDDGQFARARECFDRVLAKSPSIDPLYRRALCAIALNDFAAAAPDLERVVSEDPKYDYQRAAGLRAHVLAKLGERDKADALFADVLQTSTLSETQYNYACFLWLKAAATTRATGPSAFCGRKRRCRTTSGGASGHGSARRRDC
jgi:tetratricopeptide (TPR) repeat protein